MTIVEPKVTQPHRGRPWRWAGLALLAVPTALVTLFAVGEGLGGEEGWWGHLIQLAIVLVLLAAAWFVPKVGGPLLVAVGTAFAAVFVAAFIDQGRAGAVAPGLVLFVLPLLLAGVFITIDAFTRARE